ncbi:MAG TPA: hypothetical protein VM328_12745 [Fimbriimonadaceae bacterium]|nr:hypothetical protein [Fimbriimonadaceae bacterium]
MENERMDHKSRPTVDEHGREHHPAFGWAQVSRVSQGPRGAALFDSDIRHQQYVTLRVGRSTRERNLKQDWIHGDGTSIVEIAMSMAQWGALVSSFNTSGVPATLIYVNGERMPDLPSDDSRLALSVAETERAADDAFDTIKVALAAVKEAFERNAGRKEMKALLWSLEAATRNATPNVRYAAESLSEHVENVVTKAKFDIEALAQAQAGRELGGLPPVALGRPTESEAT